MIRILFLVSLYLLTGCDRPFFTFLWHTYEHPSYRFSIQFPRSWEMKSDQMGTAVLATGPSRSTSFKVNANVVVDSVKGNSDLNQLSERSVEHLKLLFNQYAFLGKIESRLGTLPAVEIRGKYYAVEGPRIVRNIISLQGSTEYILTFSCSDRDEEGFTSTFNAIRDSFTLKLE